jgi:protein TonB
MSEIERNKDKRVGWAVSASIHALIILLFFLINAWTAPDPPLPEYGIELNFGIEEAGSGL